MRLTYLGLIVIAVLIGVLATSRGRFGQVARNFGIWAVIIGGLTFAVGTYQGAGFMPFQTQAELQDGRIELTMQRDGHYYLTALVNGVPIEFVVDTGASHVVLTEEDAKRLGFKSDDLRFVGSATTANGIVQTAPVRLETVELGPILDRNVRAVVNGGPMRDSLLGMSYLSRFEKIEITRGRLILTR
ncbi:retropepsin-like aspartic protease family protein [Marivivens donghaensis]|nr:TIGR02281 family clan AA aspartic protease [Marivivens donghaensis]